MSSTLDPTGGTAWPFAIWADDDSQLGSLRPYQDVDTSTSLDHLAAAQTWEEVLALPADPTQRLPRMIASDPGPRTNVRVSERPDRGRTTVRHADGTVSVLAADGSPADTNGRSTKRQAAAATRTRRQRERAFALGEVLVVDDRPAAPSAPRYVMVDGEAVDLYNADGSIG